MNAHQNSVDDPFLHLGLSRWLALGAVGIGVAAFVGAHAPFHFSGAIGPEVFTIPYSVALGFLVAGAAVFLALGRHTWWGAALGGIDVLYGLFVAMHYVVNSHTPVVSAPAFADGKNLFFVGGVARLGTALGLMTAGMAAMILSQRRDRMSFRFAIVLGSFLVAQSLMALGACLKHMILDPAWIHSLSLYGIATFFLLGISILWQVITVSWQLEFSPWIPLALTTAMMVVTIALSQVQFTRDREQTSDLIDLEAQRTAGILSTRLQAYIRESERLVARSIPGIVAGDLSASAHPAIGWLSADGQTHQWLNAVGTGDDAVGGEGFARIAETARQRDSTFLYGSAELQPNHVSMVVVIPSYARGDLDGFHLVAWDKEGFLRRLVDPALLEEFAFLFGFADGSQSTINALGDIAGPWSAPADLEIDNANWTIRVAPTQFFLEHHRLGASQTVAGIGIALSIILGLAVSFAQSSWRRARTLTRLNKTLETEIAQRTVTEARLRDSEEAVRRANAELEQRVQERTGALNEAMQSMRREIGARERAEQELAERAEELAATNEELEQFAVVASHDLQEPLRKIASYGELLETRYKGRLDERADKFIGYMVDGARRMQALIRNLLSYARAGRKDAPNESIDLTALVRSVVADLEASIQEHKATVVFDELPVITANSAQMGQLFQNLLSNALKFRSENFPCIRIAATAREQEHDWLFSVSDNGIGIAPDHRERIFQIFQRIHSPAQFPGTGVGLAVCKKIVERHGGRIWVDSQPGSGAIFFFTLPAAIGNDVMAAGAPPAREGEKVL